MIKTIMAHGLKLKLLNVNKSYYLNVIAFFDKINVYMLEYFAMKKSEKIEMKIYESLGIKTFRKMAFLFRDSLISILSFRMPKEKRKELLYRRRNNYNIGKIESVEDLKSFKKYLYLNAFIHLWALGWCMPGLLKIFNGVSTTSEAIICSLFTILNSYCIMLQRYNYIRINNVIKKMAPRYEKQKSEYARELKKEDKLLLDHKYTIVDKKGREEYISFDDLIKNASLKELKDYREYLLCAKIENQKLKNSDKNQRELTMSIQKNKTLKLELKNNTNRL